MRLPTLPYLRLRATLRAEEPARLPPFQGSMLRGAFGHALRRAVCVMGPAQPCETCTARQVCAYTRIFETFVEGEVLPPFLKGIDQAVRPYVFEPQESPPELAPGETLSFDLLLFGRAAEYQAYAAVALERMAEAGLAAGRRRFSLASLEPLPGSTHPAAPLPHPEKLTLRFPTPLRIKVRGHFADRPPSFRTLAFHTIRRVLEMAWFHVPGAEVDWDFRPFLDRADAIRTTAADLRWHDWERWSNRQNAAMKLGGLVGTMTLEGELAPFAELLRLAEVVHVGKGATFGLGRVVVS
jgi:hypothetical protein